MMPLINLPLKQHFKKSFVYHSGVSVKHLQIRISSKFDINNGGLQGLMLSFWLQTGGYLAHSLAIMTDAAHLLTDFGSMMVSLFSLWISSRPSTKTMTFGWHRSGQHKRADQCVFWDNEMTMNSSSKKPDNIISD